jgi:hypothetical protein
MILGICVSVMWMIYLVGWRFIRSSRSHGNLSNQGDTGSSDNANRKIRWPICRLRPSNQILLFLIMLSDIIGFCFNNLQAAVFGLIGIDIRLVSTEFNCRAQFLLSYFGQETSLWLYVVLCFERSYIFCFPTSAYSLNRSNVKAVIIASLVVHVATLMANVFVLIPSEKICFHPLFSLPLTVFKQLYATIIPLFLITLCLILLLLTLIRHSRNIDKPGSHKTSCSTAVATTKMLLCGSIFLVIVNFPFVVLRTLYMYFDFVFDPDSFCFIERLVMPFLRVCSWSAICLRSYVFILTFTNVRKDIWTIISIALRVHRLRKIYVGVQQYLKSVSKSSDSRFCYD